MQIYGANPNGLPEGWDWSAYDQANGTTYSTTSNSGNTASASQFGPLPTTASNGPDANPLGRNNSPLVNGNIPSTNPGISRSPSSIPTLPNITPDAQSGYLPPLQSQNQYNLSQAPTPTSPAGNSSGSQGLNSLARSSSSLTSGGTAGSLGGNTNTTAIAKQATENNPSLPSAPLTTSANALGRGNSPLVNSTGTTNTPDNSTFSGPTYQDYLSQYQNSDPSGYLNSAHPEFAQQLTQDQWNSLSDQDKWSRLQGRESIAPGDPRYNQLYSQLGGSNSNTNEPIVVRYNSPLQPSDFVDPSKVITNPDGSQMYLHSNMTPGAERGESPPHPWWQDAALFAGGLGLAVTGGYFLDGALAGGGGAAATSGGTAATSGTASGGLEVSAAGGTSAGSAAASTAPSWFPGTAETWNTISSAYTTGRYAMQGISLYQFANSLINGGQKMPGNNPLTTGTTPGSNTNTNTNTDDNGLDINGLAIGAASLYLDNNVINNYKDQVGQYLNQGDYNSQYRPGQLSQLNDFLSHPSDALNDPGYKQMRQQGLDNVSRTMAARGMSLSGNEMGELEKYGENLDYTHLNDIENQLRQAADQGNPNQLYGSAINSAGFVAGMQSNRNNDIMNSAGSALKTVGTTIQNLLKNGPKLPDGTIDWNKVPDSVRQELNVPDPASNPEAYAQWSQQTYQKWADMPDPGSDPEGYMNWVNQNYGGSSVAGGGTDVYSGGGGDYSDDGGDGIIDYFFGGP